MLERERDFFLGNPLLQGLRPDRWGTVTLKQLLVRFQVRGLVVVRWVVDGRMEDGCFGPSHKNEPPPSH